MEGVINFLTNKNDLRAHLLRKMFVFMIVPMINVDGVYHGHFRMDINGKNLNRFYLNPDPKQQPSVYAIKELANHLCK
jgi:murein tripeptide amidase MpaA